MEDRDLDIARATLLESLGRTLDAAELHLSEGRPLQAIDLFLRDQGDQSSMVKAHTCIVQGLWQQISFGIPQKDCKTDDVASHLLQLATRLNASLLTQADHDQVRFSTRSVPHVLTYRTCLLFMEDFHVSGPRIWRLGPSADTR